ncbi:hypothetical protein DJ031_04680 [bacterium endosymbiont of Escarpia laminata]|nr:MAG: hypothetical protein DJ031_04680 [bacterium endosymbiont of Escarpia laminata]
MAILAIAAIGAGIGGTLIPAGILGMSGAAIGWAAGSIIGNYLFAPEMPDVNQQGPRVTDDKVTNSSYGVGRVKGYGTYPTAGNVFDQSSLYEIEHTETFEAGKGGGGGSVTNTTWTYERDIAVGLGEGPIGGILQIWANEDLIYDATPDATVVRPDWLRMKVYLGSETQEPDPTLQALHGATDTPAYRGEAYVVFSRYYLANHGQNPSFRFVVARSAALSHPITNTRLSEQNHTLGALGKALKMPSGLAIYAYNRPLASSGNIAVAMSLDTQLPQFEIAAPYSEAYGYFGAMNVISLCSYDGSGYGSHIVGKIGGGSNYRVGVFDAISGALVDMTTIAGGSLTYVKHIYSASPSGFDLFSIHLAQTSILELQGSEYVRVGVMWFRTGWLNSEYMGAVRPDTEDLYIPIQFGADEAIAIRRKGANTYSYVELTSLDSGISAPQNFVFDSVRALTWAICATTTHGAASPVLISINASGTIVDVVDFFTDYGLTEIISGRQNHADFDDSTGCIYFGYGEAKILAWNTTTMAAPDEYSGGYFPDQIIYHHQTDKIYSFVQMLWVDSRNASVSSTRTNALTSNPVSLQSVVEDICSETDLEIAEIDAAQLVSYNVTGYRRSGRMPARSIINPLRQAFLFDIVDLGGQLLFQPHGSGTVINLTEDELGAHAYGTQPPEKLTPVRTPIEELPSELSLTYINPDRFYENGVQSQRRLASTNRNTKQVVIPLVLTDDQAAKIVDSLLHLAHIEAVAYSLSLLPSRLGINGGDILNVPKGSRNHIVRAGQITFEGGYIKVQGVRHDSDARTSYAQGGSAPVVTTTIAAGGVALAWVLDIPALRYQDHDPGVYVAASSYSVGWRGGELFRSLSGSDFYSLIPLPVSVVGFCETVPADVYPNRWDTTNTLTITLLSGDLFSASDANLLAGSNAAAWGAPGRWEIVQYGAVTEQPDGTFTVSRLLRGRRGTDWAMGQHVVGDVFIPLSTSNVRRVKGDTTEIGSTFDYRGVTFGESINAPTVVTKQFSHAGHGIKPWGPAHLAVSEGGGGDLAISWLRRGRMPAAPLGTPPLVEESERYEIDIYDGDTVVRTITDTPTANGSVVTPGSQLALYDGADRAIDNVVDFGCRGYQISAVIGRGYPSDLFNG